MATMTATKMLTYNNRRLVPGEDFEAKSYRDQKVLLATRKAKLKRVIQEVPPPPPEVQKRIVEATDNSEAEAIAAKDLAAARSEYKAATGKNAYYGWSAEHIRELIANLGS